MEPGARFSTDFRRALLEGHPYGRSIGGTDDQIAALSVDKIQAFHDRFYTGANLQLVIAGPLEAQAVLDAVRPRYQDIPIGTRTSPPPAVAAPDVRRPVRLRHPDAPADLVGLSWPLPDVVDCRSGKHSRCVRDYWLNQVTLAMLEGTGAVTLSHHLSRDSLGHIPVGVTMWQGAAGGYVAVLALRLKPGLVFLHNAGALIVDLLFLLGIASGGVDESGAPMAAFWQYNATPARLESVLEDETWANEEAVREARNAVRRDVMRESWDPGMLALQIAARNRLGLDEDPLTLLNSIHVDDVILRYEDLVVLKKGRPIYVR